MITSLTLPPAREPKKGRHSGNAGLFRPRYEQEADEMKRDLRVLATASAVLLPMGTASAQSKAGSSKSAILTVQRACRCSRNQRSQPTGRRWACSTTLSCLGTVSHAQPLTWPSLSRRPTREGRPALLHQFSLAVHLDDLKVKATASIASPLAFTGRFRVDRSTCVPRDQPKRSF